MVLKPETRLTWGVHIASLLPALWLFVQWQTANLGANPVQAITRQTGRIAVILAFVNPWHAPLPACLGGIGRAASAAL